MPKVGVILSGCGVQDGSEIHEAVLTLLALDEAGASIVCMAPNKNQTMVVDHTTGKPTGETRNVLVEAARIARGNIKDIAEVSASQLDAVVMPGGFGAALNLCNFATAGEKCEIDSEVSRLLKEMHSAGKPIGAVCIAPAVVARALGEEAPKLTIGNDVGTAAALEKLGADHVDCPVEDVVIDEKNRVVTSPAYMLAGSIKDLRSGITKTVTEVLRMAKSPATQLK